MYVSQLKAKVFVPLEFLIFYYADYFIIQY